MQSLKYRITTIAPVLITTNVGDVNTVGTNEFISGSSVLGVFAKKFIEKLSNPNIHEDDNFYNWFLNRKLNFTNAYIVYKTGDNKYYNNFPIPFSIQQDKDNNDIIDLLAQDDDSDKDTKSIGGFGRIEDKNIYLNSIKKSLNFHHSRDRKTGTSKKDQIFNYESIDSEQIFEGYITGDNESLASLKQTLGDYFIAYIGRSKTSQYGKIRIDILSKPEEFSSEINECRDFDIDGNKIILTMLSNTIIYNNNGLSTTDIKELENQLGLSIVKSFIKTGTVENFVSIWKLRKPSETCFLAGSSFVLKVSENDKEKLLGLQKNGIGERRNEGFGRIVFGWQKEAQLNEIKNKKENISKPTILITSTAKDIAFKVLDKHIKSQIELKAINKLNEFERPPSNSLIGRLESMSNMNRQTFCESLDRLRKTAKDNLDKCRTKSQTLFDFIKSYDISNDLTNVLDRKTKQFLDEIKYDLESKKNSLYKVYFATFFSMMRKKGKK